jgi:ribosome-associated protein
MEKQKICLKAAIEKKAMDIVLIDLRGLSTITDYFLIMSGNSDRHTEAIGEAILEKMEEAGYKPIGVEGLSEGRWALLDFGDLVVHVFYEPIREYYDLEGLWADAPRVDWEKKFGLKAQQSEGEN